MIAIADKTKAAEITGDSKALFSLHLHLARKYSKIWWNRCPQLRKTMEWDDLHQTALIALHVASLKYDPTDGSFVPFAIGCIQNSFLDLIRKEGRDRIEAIGYPQRLADADVSRLEPDELDELEFALAQLPANYQALLGKRLGLFGFRPHETDELAAEAGVSRRAIAKQLSKARALLGGQFFSSGN